MTPSWLPRPILAAVSAFLAEVPQNSHAWTYHIRGFDQSLYLSRTLLPRLGSARPLVHRIWREDADRHMHNHPWAWARFLIVSGGYVEERPGLLGTTRETFYGPGDVNRLTAKTLHRRRGEPMKRRMLAGYMIEAQTSNTIPHVTLCKLDSKETGFLTPDEARKLADALTRAADTAESS